MTPEAPLPATPLGPMEALLYGIVQGIAEFLPVSSSTHLALLGRLLEGAGRQPLDRTYIMLFHLPTLAAAGWVLRREIRALFGSERRLLVPLGLATLVTGTLGYAIDARCGEWGASFGFLGAMLCVTGLVQLAVERWKPEPTPGGWTWDRGLAVGIGQSLAGIPGLSRLGMSTCAGMLTRRARVHAAVFSFLCAIPVTLGKTVLTLRKTMASGEPDVLTHRVLHGAYALGALVAFVLGVLAFRWLLRHLVRGTLAPFGIYCVILGALTLICPAPPTKMPPPKPVPDQEGAAGQPEPDEPQPPAPEGSPRVAPRREPVPADDQPGVVRGEGPRPAPLPPR